MFRATGPGLRNSFSNRKCTSPGRSFYNGRIEVRIVKTFAVSNRFYSIWLSNISNYKEIVYLTEYLIKWKSNSRDRRIAVHGWNVLIKASSDKVYCIAGRLPIGIRSFLIWKLESYFVSGTIRNVYSNEYTKVQFNIINNWMKTSSWILIIKD